MNIVERVKNILLKPKEEWVVIEGETTSVQELYLNYVVILAAIPTVATFFGLFLFGRGVFSFAIGTLLAMLIIGYVVNLALTYVLALIIDAMAPSFGGSKSFLQSLKISTYSFTPGWIAGVFNLIPMLGILGIIASFYGAYLLFLGVKQLLKVPHEKAIGFSIVLFLIAFVLGVIGNLVAGSVAIPRVW